MRGITPKQREVYEQKEFLEQTGQESEQEARKAVGQYFKHQQIKEEAQRTYFLERLDGRRKYNDYNKLCAQITYYYIQELDLPKNLNWKVQYDTKGVLLFVAVKRKLFQRAFKSVREPLYDLNACVVFAQGLADLLTNHGRTSQPQQA